ncbi:D-alanyl-D-alanine carboxypeptidase family protein [Patescibacteria group bacterium]
MSKGFKFFLISFFVSLPFWWGMNILQGDLEEFLFYQKITQDSQILSAQLSQAFFEEKLKSPKPLIKNDIEDLNITARSAFSVLVNSSDEQEILFEKNSNNVLPIASLTKLMTAKIVLENYDPSQLIEISKEAVAKEGDFGNLKIGEVFKAKNLLYPLLMESSNDAASALSEIISEEAFVELMNLEAENLGLENTYFINSTGLDPEEPDKKTNYSTAEDLVKLSIYLLDQDPLIWRILSFPEFNLYDESGAFHHQVQSTNKLLNSVWREKIIGGKTGWTIEARGCLLLITKAPKNRYLVSVILGSENRFEEMQTMLEWVNSAYKY